MNNPALATAAPANPPALRVEPYAGDAAAWNAFVRTAAGGTFFHQIGWKDVLERTFGFRSHYLMARRGNEIAAVLPLFILRRPLSRPVLLSLPFAVEAGICGSDPQARDALEAAARELTDSLGARYLELRDGGDAGSFKVREGLYFRFRRQLLATDEENFAAIRRKQRRMVRVGQQAGLTARVDRDDFPAFYDLYARSVRHLGTPVFPTRYFKAFLDLFPEDCTLLTVRHGTTPVAAVMSFFFGDTVLPYYAGSRQEFFRYAVNDFMYWELMRYARERGAREFDFGRSKLGTGAYDFKCHWGFEPQPLRYRVYGAAEETESTHSVNDSSIQWLRQSWQRLPLPVTKALGPVFIRYFGAYYT